MAHEGNVEWQNCDLQNMERCSSGQLLTLSVRDNTQTWVEGSMGSAEEFGFVRTVDAFYFVFKPTVTGVACFRRRMRAAPTTAQHSLLS